MRMKALMMAMALALPTMGVEAAPADVAAAVAATDRPAEAVKLDESRRPAEVLTFLGLEKGEDALDLFTGTGYYAEIMGRAVGPEGSVVAWEPANFYDEKAKETLAAVTARVPNVRVHVAPATAPALPENSFDFAMLHLNYHDAYWESEKYKFPRLDPAAFLGAIHAAMKPGGTVGVIDHVATPGGDTREVVEALHRIDPAVIRADFERAGFVFDGESDLLRNPDDDHAKSVFDPAVRGKTDRVVYRFRKPAA
ncbi:class I SAM-dependent methyltransferase [Sphingosinicella humi]|nr:methyltransferase domain-containing protein [Sphingosinicella humi]